MAIWLPGYTRVNLGLSGKPFEYLENPKGLLHRTEGTSLAGAESAMRAYPSHLGYDPFTREKHQYISLDLAAYSAMDESDDDPIYQVEIVGFSKDSRYMSDQLLRNIAEDVMKPLADAVGIPPVAIGSGFKDGLDNVYPYLATPQSPIRLSYGQLRAFSGWLGHQHLPAPDDHWDPGAINIRRLIELAYGDDMNLDDSVKTPDGRWVYVKDALGSAPYASLLLERLAPEVKALRADVTALKATGVPVDVRLSDEDVDRVATALATKLAKRLES